MFDAVCIALMLAGLWSLLSLFALVADHHELSGQTAPSDRLRRQRRLCLELTAALCCLPLFSLALANWSNWSLIMAPAAMINAHLFLGTGFACRQFERLTSDPDTDPNLHILALACLWPLWITHTQRELIS